MKIMRIMAVMLVLAGALAMVGCQDEGPAEKAGKKIDQAVEKAGEKVEETTDKMGGAVEKMGDKVQEETN